MSLVALFAALSGISAFVRLPIPYIPLTLQPLMVMFSGLLLGGRLGALSQLVYLLVGLLGIPIFAQGGGPGYVLQPTFGFLLGFILGAYVIGRLTERREPLHRGLLLVAILVGIVAMYIPGVTVFYLNLNLIQQKSFSLREALLLLAVPYLPADLLKLLVVLYLGPPIRERFRRMGGGSGG
jgi:biotin transport system substrate-specific component